jgi:topoisomerase IA-like protein
VWLSLPRRLGEHPEGGDVTASAGRFGPFIAHNGVFASIKAPDNVYTIELPRALTLLEEKIKRLKARGKYKPALEATEADIAEKEKKVKKPAAKKKASAKKSSKTKKESTE